MSAEIDNPVLEHLRHIRAAVEQNNQKLSDLTIRVGMIETQFAGVEREIAGLYPQYAHVSTRFDRVDARLEKIECRLGLIEA
jgi:hypothetical protein